MARERPDHLVVATIGRAVGTRGEVEIHVWSDHPARFDVGSALLLDAAASAAPRRSLTIRSSRRHGGRHVVAFVGVDDRTSVEAMRGRDLLIPVGDARALDEQEYWDHDLIGCAVRTTDGRQLGEVADVMHAAANDVLVVRAAGRELLVPMVAQVIATIDVDARTIAVEPVLGLLGEDE